MKTNTDISSFKGPIKRGPVMKAKFSGIWKSIPQAGIKNVTRKPDFRRRDMGMTEENHG